MKRKPATPPRDYHHGDLRRVLVDGALAVLERDGAAALSLRALARDAAVSHAAPYNHFADKEALLAALAAEGFRRFAAALAAAAAAAPDAPLLAIGGAYVAFARARPALFRLMFGPVLAGAAPGSELAEAARRAYGVLGGALGGGPRAATPRTGQPGPDDDALAAWALVHGLATLLIDRALPPGREPEALVGRVLRRVRFGGAG
jgi:AcrR family transcriptional regulator